MKSRVYSVTEINRLVPQLNTIIGQLIQKKEQMQKKHDQIMILELIAEDKIHDPESSDGKEYLQQTAELESLILSMEDDIARISELGGYLRDLDMGSVDFYSILRNEIVFLNWQRGEREISFYHPLSSPFTMRKPILTN